MATRYSGDLTITLTYRDPHAELFDMYPNGDYRATISWPSRARGGKHRRTIYVGAPKYLRQAVDSPEAYDSAAHAAISFAAEEESEIGERAAIGTDGWLISRNKDRKWMGPRMLARR